MLNEILKLEIRGKEYKVYYKEGDVFTNFPCPLHGYAGGERIKRGIVEIIAILTENGNFRIKRDADLFLLREILVLANETVGQDEIICETCLKKCLAI